VPQPPQDPSRLATWHGSPFDAWNQGCLLQPGTLVCEIGDPRRLEAVLVIDQGDMDFVARGQMVEVKLDELPHDVLAGRIAEISRNELVAAPASMSNKAGGELATTTDELGRERPQSASYQARVPLDDTAGVLQLGLRGRAKVHVGYRTLAGRLWRYAARTFRFSM
jgi:putative peptide zinc metalloprotease protein